MTSLTGKEIITVNILPNISKSKSNQAIKLGQAKKYNVKILKNYAENEDVSSRPFFCFSRKL